MLPISTYMGYFPFIILALFLLVISSFTIIGYIRKRRAIGRICNMNVEEKIDIVNKVSDPFGFRYQSYGDIFAATKDAWQRDFGYCRLYDRNAFRFSMILDCEPVYFDYQGKTWLIEFWKGQYGVTTGAEIGIYRANRIIRPEDYGITFFRTATNDEMLPLSFQLMSGKEILFSNYGRHWWLTGFRAGMFSQPRDLRMNSTITFPDYGMLNAFVNALLDLGYSSSDIQVRGSNVSFQFERPLTRPPRLLGRLRISFTQTMNRFFVRMYLFITRPFDETLDRLLYLELQMPRAFRRLFRVRKYPQVRRIFRRVN